MNRSPESIQERIDAVPAWWHNIEIGNLRTPGITHPASQKWIESALPADFSGKEVLDIGCWDGYYSFLAEKRKAKRVVALDPGQGPCKPLGFLTAHELLDSKVELKTLDVYQLAQVEGKFDYIFFFGVYYHLQDPVLALHLIFNKLKPGGVLLMEGLVRSGSKPYLYTYRPGVDLCPGDFCAATVPWLLLNLQAAGFAPAEFLSRYKGNNLFDRPVRSLAWHLGLHAGKLKKAHRALIRAVRPEKDVFDEADSEARDTYLAKHVSGLSGNA